MTDLSRILKLLEEGIKIKDAISHEVAKEKDAKRRKKLNDACQRALDSGSDNDLAAIRGLLFDLD